MDAIDLIDKLIQSNSTEHNNLVNLLIDRNDILGMLQQWVESNLPVEYVEAIRKLNGYPRLTPGEVRIYIRDSQLAEVKKIDAQLVQHLESCDKI